MTLLNERRRRRRRRRRRCRERRRRRRRGRSRMTRQFGIFGERREVEDRRDRVETRLLGVRTIYSLERKQREGGGSVPLHRRKGGEKKRGGRESYIPLRRGNTFAGGRTRARTSGTAGATLCDTQTWRRCATPRCTRPLPTATERVHHRLVKKIPLALSLSTDEARQKRTDEEFCAGCGGPQDDVRDVSAFETDRRVGVPVRVPRESEEDAGKHGQERDRVFEARTVLGRLRVERHERQERRHDHESS